MSARVTCHLVQPYPTRKEFKNIIKGAKTQSFGLFLNSSSPQIAEQLAAARQFDWLLVDAQHSPVGINHMQFMLSSLATHKCPALVRVGGPDDRIGIQQALDLGAWGVMIPTVRTIEDVRKAVDAAFFPPLGSRSFAAPISSQLGRPVAEFLKAVNDETILILQIETKESLENVDKIVNFPGVDALFIGPFDLSYALGLFDKYGFPGGMQTDELRKASQRVAQSCRASGVAPGSFCASAEGAEVLVKEGFTLIGVGTDVGLLGNAVVTESDKLHGLRDRDSNA